MSEAVAGEDSELENLDHKSLEHRSDQGRPSGRRDRLDRDMPRLQPENKRRAVGDERGAPGAGIVACAGTHSTDHFWGTRRRAMTAKGPGRSAPVRHSRPQGLFIRGRNPVMARRE